MASPKESKFRKITAKAKQLWADEENKLLLKELGTAALLFMGQQQERVKITENNINFPGIYVYSYPSYLSQNTRGKFLLKVGMSEVSVKQRLQQQRRMTEVPEDLMVVRDFPSSEARRLEKFLHEKLKAQQQQTARGGREWFWTTVEEIEALLWEAGFRGKAYYV